MAKEVKLGLVGCGSVSQRGLLPHLVQEDLKGRCRLTAVCDNVRGRAQASARKFRVPDLPAPQAFDDYGEFLAEADVDAVTLATPIGVHFEQAMAAVAAGKHVHLNKAMTTTVAEADRLIRAAKKARIKIVASPGQMLRPVHRLIREWVKAGAIGRPYFTVNGMAFAGHEYEDFRQPGGVLTDVDPTWYYKAAGGPLLDMGVYCLHTLTGILGPGKAVTAASGIGLPKRKYKGKSITVEMDDMTILTVDFGAKGFGIVYAGFTWGSDAGRLRLHGSEGEIEVAEGRVVLNGWNKEKFPSVPAVARPENVTGPHTELPESHVYADILHLVDCIREGRKPEVTAEHARHVIEIMEKGYRAAKTGRRQPLTTTF